jgi:uncharacterized protein (DUF305 family)
MKMSYAKFLGMLGMNAVVMFLVTYAMIASVSHLWLNVNRVYMALMMVAPMALVMLFGMRAMFHSRRGNIILAAGFAAIFAVTFVLARTQTPIGDREFLRSMIPHHSSAILMCEEAALRDPEIVRLCEQIIRSQRAEIAQMEQLLARN